MANKKRKKAAPPPTIRIEEEGEDEEPGQEYDAPIDETEDIYDEKQRDEMLEDGEITAGEAGFMAGREVTERKKKKILVEDHKDTPSVELAEDDANEAD
jgi:hypothetical protein